jgi:hypothetical protein
MVTIMRANASPPKKAKASKVFAPYASCHLIQIMLFKRQLRAKVKSGKIIPDADGSIDWRARAARLARSNVAKTLSGRRRKIEGVRIEPIGLEARA